MYDYNRNKVSIIVIHTCLLLKNVPYPYYSHTYMFTPEKRAVSLLIFFNLNKYEKFK